MVRGFTMRERKVERADVFRISRRQQKALVAHDEVVRALLWQLSPERLISIELRLATAYIHTAADAKGPAGAANHCRPDRLAGGLVANDVQQDEQNAIGSEADALGGSLIVECAKQSLWGSKKFF
jgi:hypothetical protein